jgi:hypothetical protein
MLSALARAAGMVIRRQAVVARRQLVKSGLNEIKPTIESYFNPILASRLSSDTFLSLYSPMVLPVVGRAYSSHTAANKNFEIKEFLKIFQKVWTSSRAIDRQVLKIIDSKREVLDPVKFKEKQNQIIDNAKIAINFFQINLDLNLTEAQKNDCFLKLLDLNYTKIPEVVKKFGLSDAVIFKRKGIAEFFLELWTRPLPTKLQEVVDVYRNEMGELHRLMLIEKDPESLRFSERSEGLARWMMVHLRSVASLDWDYLLAVHSKEPSKISIIKSYREKTATLSALALYATLGIEDLTDKYGDPEAANKLRAVLNLNNKDIDTEMIDIKCLTLKAPIKPIISFTIEAKNKLIEAIEDLFQDKDLKEKARNYIVRTLIDKADTHMASDRISPEEKAKNVIAGMSTMMVAFFYEISRLATLDLASSNKAMKLDIKHQLYTHSAYFELVIKNCELARIANDLTGYKREAREEQNPLANIVWRKVDRYVVDGLNNRLSDDENNSVQKSLDTAYMVNINSGANDFKNPNSVMIFLDVAKMLRRNLCNLYLLAAPEKFQKDPSKCRKSSDAEKIEDAIRMNGIDPALKNQIIFTEANEKMMQYAVHELLKKSEAISECFDEYFMLEAEASEKYTPLKGIIRKNKAAWSNSVDRHKQNWSILGPTYWLASEEDGGN